MTSEMPQDALEPASKHYGHALAIGALVLAALAEFADVLAGHGTQVLSKFGNDATGEFVAFRAFGFSELAHGHLPLWNPYIFGGVPFLANFQSAFFYPPNLIYLLLPVNQAINVDLSSHVLLAGLCMYAWCAYRRLHPAAALTAGLAFMFGGFSYLHIYVGHLPHLDTIAWAPLVFLAVDDLTLTRSLRGIWLGGSALAMQILAGHPQFFFYTVVGAGMYALLNLRDAPSLRRSIIGLIVMFASGAALAAAQLVPGLAVAGETMRDKLDPMSAGDTSMPPETLPGLIAPGLFGPFHNTNGVTEFWGRAPFTESSLFVGLTVVCLAFFACKRAPKRTRRFAATLGVLSLFVALGKFTPLFHILYHVPGFANFRAWARFNILTGLFLAMLAALGLDRLLKGDIPGKRPAIMLLLLATPLLAVGLLMLHEAGCGTAGIWGKALAWNARRVSHPNPEVSYIASSAHNVATELLRTGFVAIVLAALWWAVRRDRRAAYVMAVVAALELTGFARRYRATFDWAMLNATNLETAQRLQAVDGDARTWSRLQDVAIRFDCPQAWGDDATVLRRYAELIAATNDVPVSELVRLGVKPNRQSPVWQLIRVRSFVEETADGQRRITAREGPVIDRAMLLGDWRVVPDRKQIIEAIKKQTFDPSQTALLEKPVAIAPSGSGFAGTVQRNDINSDTIELTIDAKRPAILVLAENYASGWQATSIDGEEGVYEVVPVDSVLRGIAVAPGKHHLRVQYRPRSIAAGEWISMISCALFALGGARALFMRDRNGVTRRRQMAP